jgi:RimJ/RimL family protein N-acetyltransferase
VQKVIWVFFFGKEHTSAMPVVKTPRLILRPPTLDDLDGMTAMWAEESVTRFIAYHPNGREECWYRLLREAGHWALLGFGYWVVTDRQTGMFLGKVGVSAYRRQPVPGLGIFHEAGWVLNTAAQGKGLGREALTAALAWWDDNFPDCALHCMISPDNTVSHRMAMGAGFIRVSETEFRDRIVDIYRREPSITAQKVSSDAV